MQSEAIRAPRPWAARSASTSARSTFASSSSVDGTTTESAWAISAYDAVGRSGSHAWGSPSGVATTRSYQSLPGGSCERLAPKISEAIAVS